MADTTLTADQAVGDVAAFVAGAGPAARGFLIKIDSELELVTWHGDQAVRPWQVERGVLGTTAAAHSNGATVTVQPAVYVGPLPTPTVRAAAGVPTGAPTGTELPLAADTTAVSGGMYAWSGSAWVKVATV